MDLVFDEYHWVARYYHWGRLDLKEIPIRERKQWVNRIVAHEKMLKGVEDPITGGEN